ncbi:MAG: hypothetical protein Q8P51_08080 [Ignavibacteria bacterium]|nr:hypothetical protein [Ignavibacteria bacterium]
MKIAEQNIDRFLQPGKRFGIAMSVVGNECFDQSQGTVGRYFALKLLLYVVKVN